MYVHPLTKRPLLHSSQYGHTYLVTLAHHNRLALYDNAPCTNINGTNKLYNSSSFYATPMNINVLFYYRKDIKQFTSAEYGNCFTMDAHKYKAWRSGPDHGNLFSDIIRVLLNITIGNLPYSKTLDAINSKLHQIKWQSEEYLFVKYIYFFNLILAFV